jgi:hypothetical protein
LGIKRFLASIVLPGALLGLPLAAAAGTTAADDKPVNPIRCVPKLEGLSHCHYIGAVSPTGSIDFTVKKLHDPDRTIISSFGWTLPLKCEDGEFTQAPTYVYHSSTLKNGHFHAHIRPFYVGFDSPGKAVYSSLDISGSLSAGTIHRYGKILHSGGSGIASQCDSGVLKWTAHQDKSRP